MLYGAPVRIDAVKYENKRQKYVRVQRRINLRITKAYRTKSSEALYTRTGITPIIISTEVAVKLNIRKTTGNQTPEMDEVVELKDSTPRMTQTELLRRRTTRTN